MTRDVPDSVLSDDLGRVFGDWQETVTYRQVTSTFDPETETRSDTPTDTQVNAIVREIDARVARSSAGMYQPGDVEVAIRDAEMPERPPARTSRLLRGTEVWHVVGHEQSGDGMVWLLRCRKV